MLERKPRSFPSIAAGLFVVSGLVGCTDLTAVETNQCGNRVVEPEAGEDCDGEAGCGAEGTDAECRYQCTIDGKTQCPEGFGFGCGVDGLCRRPGGSFTVLRAESTSTIRDLLTGDINDDGCAEVVLTGAHTSTIEAFSSSVGDTCVSSEQTLEGARPEAGAAPVPAPVLVDLAEDDGADTLSLVSSTRALYGDGLSVHFTSGSPALSPVLFPMFARPGASLRSLRVKLHGADVVLFLEQRAGAAKTDVTLVFDPSQSPSTFTDALAADLASITSVVAADFAADGPSGPCDDVVVASGGAKTLALYRLCGPSGELGFFSMPSITLDGETSLRTKNASIVAADMNADGQLDLLTNAADGAIHVAYGLGDGRFHSKDPPDPMAADQHTGSASVDSELGSEERIFVAGEFNSKNPGLELVGIPCPPSDSFGSPTCGEVAGGCEAVVADIDADGDMDIVSTEGQELDVGVRRRVGDGTFHVSFLPTSCPPHHVDVGDLDGDGVSDIAFFDQTSKGPNDNTTALSIAYGNALAEPSAPVFSGRFDEAEGLSVVGFGKEQGGAQLAVTRTLGAGTHGSAIGVVEVGDERAVVAPFYLSTSSAPGEPVEDETLVAQAAGRFVTGTDGASRAALAVITQSTTMGAVETKLWLVRSDEDAGSLRAQKEGDGTDVACTDACILVRLPQGGDMPDKLLLLGSKTVVVYRAEAAGFVEETSFETTYAFRALVADSNPPQYTPRPLVGLIDGDAQYDVVARATTGALVGFFGKTDGQFDVVELLEAPCADAPCGGYAAARIDVDADGELELAVVGPGHLAMYDVAYVDGKRALVPKAVAFSIDAPPSTADFTAIDAADVDGDGVMDLVIMPSSNFLTVLRGLPERE